MEELFGTKEYINRWGKKAVETIIYSTALLMKINR
jgi:hypothetical protein